MKITLYPPLSIHEQGQRPNQEDSLWPRQEPTGNEQLFIVCDGMGGHEKGEVASQTFSKALGEYIKRSVTDSLTDEVLHRAMDYAYQALDAEDAGELKKMGTTLTLFFAGREGVTVAYVGDSRIYHIRPVDGVLYQSKDHSLVYELYQAGSISFSEMATHPQKNVITKAITTGEENRVEPSICHIADVQPGDYFYLCSDGMLEQMSNQELASLLGSNDSDEKKRADLIELTKNNHDNHTAWILHVADVVQEPNVETFDFAEESTSRWNALNIRPIEKQDVESTLVAPSGTADDVMLVGAPPVVVSAQPSAPQIANPAAPQQVQYVNPQPVPAKPVKKSSSWVRIVLVVALLMSLAIVAFFTAGVWLGERKAKGDIVVAVDTVQNDNGQSTDAKGTGGHQNGKAQSSPQVERPAGGGTNGSIDTSKTKTKDSINSTVKEVKKRLNKGEGAKPSVGANPKPNQTEPSTTTSQDDQNQGDNNGGDINQDNVI